MPVPKVSVLGRVDIQRVYTSAWADYNPGYMKACFLHKLQVVANHSTQEMRGGMLSSNIQEPVSHVRYQTNNIYSWSVSLLKLKSERKQSREKMEEEKSAF